MTFKMSFEENPFAWMILAFDGDQEKVKWVCIGTECENPSEAQWNSLDKIGDVRKDYTAHLQDSHIILREDFQHWSERWVKFE